MTAMYQPGWPTLSELSRGGGPQFTPQMTGNSQVARPQGGGGLGPTNTNWLVPPGRGQTPNFGGGGGIQGINGSPDGPYGSNRKQMPSFPGSDVVGGKIGGGGIFGGGGPIRSPGLGGPMGGGRMDGGMFGGLQRMFQELMRKRQQQGDWGRPIGSGGGNPTDQGWNKGGGGPMFPPWTLNGPSGGGPQGGDTPLGDSWRTPGIVPESRGGGPLGRSPGMPPWMSGGGGLGPSQMPTTQQQPERRISDGRTPNGFGGYFPEGMDITGYGTTWRT